MTQTVATPTQAHLAPHKRIPLRLGSILVSHTLVDVYSALVPPLLGVLQVRCDLTNEQRAWLLGIGSLSSGLSQPIGAWISDRTDSRVFGALGLLMAAVCLSCIGWADSFGTLMLLFVFGMIGVGIFHPIGASSIGQMANQLPGQHRSLGISFFFLFGMIGGIVGSLIAGQVAFNGDLGFEWLRYALVPGVLLALVLHLCIRRVPHRHHEHHLMTFAPGDLSRRWMMVGLLYIANAMRFTINVTLYFLIVLWAEALIKTRQPDLEPSEVIRLGGELSGSILALVVVGMAIGGFTAGSFIPKGKEKWYLVLLPILFAPSIWLMSCTGLWGGYAFAILAGIGFASMIPVSLNLAQRLLPHRTSLASGLMLGGAWMLALVGPRLAQFCMDDLKWSLEQTFLMVAIALALAGLLCLPLNSHLLKETVHRDFN